MQRIQNRALHNAVKDTDERNLTTEQLHTKFNLDPINMRLHNRLIKTWNKIQILNEELYDATEQANDINFPDHNWWPRVGRAYVADPPEPMYVYHSPNH